MEKVLVALTCLLLAKDISGVAITPSCPLKVQQLQSRISLSANQARTSVTTSVSTAKLAISSANTAINTQLASAQNRANLATGPTAQLCKNNLNLALSSVDNQAANPCLSGAQINAINLKVNQLNRLKGSASNVCSVCAQLFPLPSQVDDKNDCVDTRLDDVDQQAEDLGSQISDDAADLQDQTGQCAEDAQSQQVSAIDDAVSKFDDCVGGGSLRIA